MVHFFCATRYTVVVYGKNCLGDVATVFNPEKYFGDFSLEIIPGAPPHLPGEREVGPLDWTICKKNRIFARNQLWPPSGEFLTRGSLPDTPQL